MPSTMSLNTTHAGTSVTTGTVCGSHSATTWPLLDPAVRIDQQAGAVGQLVARPLAPDLVVDDELGAAAEHHLTRPWLSRTRRGLISRSVAVDRRLDLRLLGLALRRAADVEGAHGQLGAGLADRLRGDDADRLARC